MWPSGSGFFHSVVMLLRFIPVVASIGSSFFFTAEQFASVWTGVWVVSSLGHHK